MHKFYKTYFRTAAAVALAGVLVAGAAQQALAQAQPAAAAQTEKKPKDAAEGDLIQEVNKDLAATNNQKAITDLLAWEQKYPDTDYKGERLAYFVLSYTALKQQDKMLDAVKKFLAIDYKAALGPGAKLLMLQTLSSPVTLLQTTLNANMTADEIATARKLAKTLVTLAADESNRPDQVPAADWPGVRTALNTAAAGIDVAAALLPGSAALAKKDYAAAEPLFNSAYAEFPENGWVAYNLGASLFGQKDETKRSKGLYLIARGVSMDPAKGGIADAATRKSLEDYLGRAYRNYHGSDEGLEALKQASLASANPAAGFKVKTATEIAEEKQKQFEKEYPELAMWMKIKAVLTAPDGEQAFEGQMKGTGLPKLKGTITAGKPECRSKELLVALPEPGQTSALIPEITIKLDTALKGKPVAGEIVFENGVPSAFSKDPLMLTVDVEQASITGLKADPCTPAPASSKKGAAPSGKKAAPKKK